MQLRGTARVSPAKISQNQFPFDFDWIPVVAQADTFYCFQMFGDPHEQLCSPLWGSNFKKAGLYHKCVSFYVG